MNNFKSNISYVNIKDEDALEKFTIQLFKRMENTVIDFSDIIILCIGSDKVIGDCVGPLTGHRLLENKNRNYFIYGTVNNPVHGKNINAIVKNIKESYRKPFIIAIDSSIGKSEKVGQIKIVNEPTNPGSSLNKDLIKVGNISISGIVNFEGYGNYNSLRNTRLAIVVNISDIICKGIGICFDNLKNMENN